MRPPFLIVLLAGAALAAPFSHKLHLKLKPDCLSCHTSIAASTRVEDNNLPSKQVCAPCHKSVSIPDPPKSLLAKFSHAQHLKLGNVAPVLKAAIASKAYLSDPGDLAEHLNSKNPCLACHRGIDQSEAVSKANLPQMADCLVCHNKIELPFSCETCHAKGAALKPVNHTADFIDAHTKKSADLNKATCALCHGRTFTCMGCHA